MSVFFMFALLFDVESKCSKLSGMYAI